jgi:RNA polymerase sigma-70 factor (sigma-E family)
VGLLGVGVVGGEMRSDTTLDKMSSMDRRRDAPTDDAIARLYRDQRRGLLQLALLLNGGDSNAAEDVVQDAFVGLQRRWTRLADREAAGGYLRQSVVNGCRSRRRREAVARRHVRTAEPDEAPSADLAALLSEEHRQVILAVRGLPPRQRQVLVLRYWLNLSESEIAAAMRISAGTVKSTASRALDALERDLEAQDAK